MTTSRPRIAAAALILLILGVLGARLLPLYLRNMELQQYVDSLTRSAENQTRPEDLLRVNVLERAGRLGLPVKANNVQIRRANGGLRIDVRYFVRVDFLMYTVDLHFYPGAGSK